MVELRSTELKLQLHPLLRVILVVVGASILPVVSIAYSYGQLKENTTVRIAQLEEKQTAQTQAARESLQRQRVIQQDLNNVITEQRVLKQQFKDKTTADRAFQKRTDKLLERIFEKLDKR